EAGHVGGAVGNDLVFRQGLTGLHHDHRGHGFHPFGIGQADYRDLAHAAQAVDHFFHFAAGHVFTAGLDHVLLAVHHRDVAFVVDGGQVTAVEPVALEGSARAFRVVEVAQHQVGRSVHDFTDFAHRYVVHGVVDHASLHVQHGPAARTRFAQLV